MLRRRAAGLTADGKQKISMGRGLVREDVNVIMFDEPLTVIDPHLKWKLRSKLKELHQRRRRHDDLRHPRPDRGADLRRPGRGDAGRRGGADRLPGRSLRAPGAHLRRPLHRLARHERPALRAPRRRGLLRAASPSPTANRGRRRRPPRDRRAPGVRLARPRRASRPRSSRVADVGRHRVVEARAAGQPHQRAPARGRARSRSGPAHLAFAPAQTRIYVDGWLAEARAMKTVEPARLVLRPAGPAARRLQRARAADDGGQLLGAGDLRQQRLLLARRRLVRGRAALARASTRRSAASCSSPRIILLIEVPLGVAIALAMPRKGPWVLGLPGADGAAAADPLERGRRDVEHLRAARHRPAWATR